MSAHEVFRRDSRSLMLSFTSGELKSKEADASSGFGVRAVEDGRVGFSFCQREADIKDAIERARRLSKFSARSGLQFAPPSKFPSVETDSRSIDPEDYGALRSAVEEAKDAAASKGGRPRVISSVTREAVSIENSGGLSGSYSKAVFSLYVECMHADGFGQSYFSSIHRPEDVAALGRHAAEMAAAMQGAGRPDAGAYRVVLEPEALEGVLGVLMASFSGDWKRRGITRIAAGQKIFSEMLTMHDDGLASASGAQPFDDEGTPSERRALVGNGAAKSFLYDRETAALEGVAASGACERDSYDSPPSIGSSNLVIAPGDVGDLAELGRHLEVHYAHGSHTANPTTGDMGLEVSAAFLVDKGVRTPMKGFMLSGNVFDMFSGIEAMEKKQTSYGSLISPRIAFRGLRVVS